MVLLHENRISSVPIGNIFTDAVSQREPCITAEMLDHKMPITMCTKSGLSQSILLPGRVFVGMVCRVDVIWLSVEV